MHTYDRRGSRHNRPLGVQLLNEEVHRALALSLVGYLRQKALTDHG
ncbi:hypothetical protein [Streptomyces sp. NPDC052036]